MKTNKKNEICEPHTLNREKIEEVKKLMISDEKVKALAETFKTLSDPTRTKIIYALFLSELCVCDLANVINLSVSAVSHHLRVLRNLKLVKFRKEGRVVYYSLDDEHISNLFHEGLEHILE
ncbi:metalloregulator ArsR/SmtB family transcription factor [SCandidatus Aminicenantes bacterium Aminicenantia_JdfR_composite]|jgi:DNA-binding transcriptional ArsR family regulator|nr:metalloregulator ArsR/SmtB family transcription factor [SCandidatus Aminicenantes bacterium Aminicenantia_JdfR_composite]MCP2596896.1 metalloregulator ArsR/SmtB family transcription factor [Candidatus Aminicenantes bacterium AC-335-G13]